MPCYHPLHGWKSKTVEPSGKRKIVFNPKEAWSDIQVELPCGQCIGCRLERSRQWAIRCVHEASLYDANSFITLTYDAINMPNKGSLVKRDFQLFMKRLRKKYTQKIRFYHCGEYGESCKKCGNNRLRCTCKTFKKDIGRPHYHAILFNIDFADKWLFKEENKIKTYVSEELTQVWGKGFCLVGDVTFESAAYVARYVLKKINGEKAEKHYMGRAQEYTTMSRRPGVGKGWYEKYKTDVYPDDFVVLRGKKLQPPKYYDIHHEVHDVVEMKKIKIKRGLEDPIKDWNNSYDRLRVREEIQHRKLEQLKRPLEGE